MPSPVFAVTTLAGEWFFVRVDEEMGFELVGIGKSRRAMLAGVRALSSVDSEMPSQIRDLNELPVAMLAVIGSFASVQSHVGLQMMISRKPFMTFRTFERFFARVRPFVILQNVLVSERSVTYAASKLLVPVRIFAGVIITTAWGRRSRCG